MLGQSVTFTAAIGTSGGVPPMPTATGTVQYFDGAKAIGSATVAKAQAQFTTSTLGGGRHIIIAQYSGDSSWPAAQTSYEQNVLAPETMSAWAAPAAPVYGQAVALSAGVGASTLPSGFTAPTGQVTFSLEGSSPFAAMTPLGSGTLASGVASINSNAIPVGAHYIMAQYSGDATWPATSKEMVLTVAPAATSSTISLAIVSGQFVLTGTVTPVAPGAGTPTGSLQFVDTSSNQPLASATLTAGKASATITSTPAPNLAGHAIVAVYSGDANFNASTSAALPSAASATQNPSGTFAADEIVTLTGIGGLGGDATAAPPLSTSLGGVTVTVTDSAGVSRASLLYGIYAQIGQVLFVVPDGTAMGLATVTAALPGGATQSVVVNIANTAPGLFTANGNGQGPVAGEVLCVHADGAETSTDAAEWSTAARTFVAVPIDLNVPNQPVYLLLNGTGLAHAKSITATVKGVSVQVSLSGEADKEPGLDPLKLGPLPASLAGAGVVNIVVTVDGQAANTVTAAIE
jgi:uncharacterized protein (TIGR03437 family)